MTCFTKKHIINSCLTRRNGAQFLNVTFVLLSAVTVIFPVTKANASE